MGRGAFPRTGSKTDRRGQTGPNRLAYGPGGWSPETPSPMRNVTPRQQYEIRAFAAAVNTKALWRYDGDCAADKVGLCLRRAVRHQPVWRNLTKGKGWPGPFNRTSRDDSAKARRRQEPRDPCIHASPQRRQDG